MAFDLMEDDVSIISKLGDEPNEDDGLTSAELKARFDSAPNLLKAAFNRLVQALSGSSAAENIGFLSTNGVQANNVQAAIENVQGQLQGISQGAVPDGSITTAKIHDGAVTADKLDPSALSRLSVSWADISENVTLEALEGVSNIVWKNFRYSAALGIVAFRFLLYVTANSSRCVVEHTGYMPSYATAFSTRDAACATSGFFSQSVVDGVNTNIFEVKRYGDDLSSTSYVYVSGWYFYEGE